MFRGKLVDVGPEEISIHAEYIGTSFDIYTRDALRDIISQHWSGQSIVIYSLDGEPIVDLGVVEFMSLLCVELGIPREVIQFSSHDDSDYGFNKQVRSLGIFLKANEYLSTMPAVDQSSRYVGTVVGRFSPPRLRAIYSLYQEFGEDCFIINNEPVSAVDHRIKNVAHLYQREIEWANQYQFDQDVPAAHPVGWITSYQNYHNIWGKYKIEVIVETHVNESSNYWFTEKTARALATGKPFLLFAGTGALARLHDMGFKTFGNLIDESYDQEKSWTTRIRKIVGALQELKSRNDFDNAINLLYLQAQRNQENYRNYCKLNQ